MAEIREAGLKVLDHLQALNSPACVVDLSALDYMGSSLVASIVRIWKAVKEKNGQMVVVTSSDRIHDVLKTTGLTKVWTITSTFEAGVHALGYSPEAKVEKRELRLLEFVGPFAVVGSSLLVATKVVPQIAVPFPIPNWAVYTALALALLTSCVAMFRERGIQRILSSLGFALAIPVLSFFLWHTEFRTPAPAPLSALKAPQAVVPRPSSVSTPESITSSGAGDPDVKEASIGAQSPEAENGDDVLQVQSGSEEKSSNQDRTPPAENNSAPDHDALPTSLGSETKSVDSDESQEPAGAAPVAEPTPDPE